MIPTKSYPRQYREIWPEVEAGLRRCFFEDDPILGEAVTRFERALAAYHQVAFAIGVGSGSDALTLAVSELGIGNGDEIVTCAHTFSGVLVTLMRAGVRPILVDADPSTMVMDVDAVESALSPRTRAILAVHLYGHAVDVQRLRALAARHDVHLLEDVAQAHGGRFAGEALGSFGKASILSFHPSKNLGAFGDGGAVLTDDRDLAERLRIARNLGKSGKYAFTALGMNSKLDSLQAALLEIKLSHLDDWNARRRRLAELYRAQLADLNELTLPCEAESVHHVHHLFVVRTPERDALRAHLSERGINTGLHYPIAAHRQPALAPFFQGLGFAEAERIAAQCLTLPLSHEHTEADVATVASAVREFYRK
jgi:dTDP-4-amino-4,6-dideoxygalactose transaminase